MNNVKNGNKNKVLIYFILIFHRANFLPVKIKLYTFQTVLVVPNRITATINERDM